jgi:UDP-2,3-diacylglucosamine hydrolase
MKKTLFISDLHLHESRPLVTRAFFQFLESAKSAEALYILGDFFDAWIGDDDDQPLVKDVIAQLQSLSKTGTRIFLMHGNRDFLIGKQFIEKINATLLADEVCINLYGVNTLLLHGDSLCTADTDYMQFRGLVRNPVWQEQFLSQPIDTRRAIANELRNKSKSMNSLKADDILDVTASEVEKYFQQFNVKRMIHGHTHRPARHQLTIKGTQCERIVLGDWHDNFWFISADENKLELVQKSI